MPALFWTRADRIAIIALIFLTLRKEVCPHMWKNRNFLLICLLNIVSWLSLYMLNTTIVPYAKTLGAATSVAGIVSGLYFVASFGTRPFSGVLGDRFSRKKLFLFSSVLLAVAGLGLIFVKHIWLLLVLRALQGVGYSITTTIAMALAADTLPADQIGAGIGYFGLTTVIGQMAGPAMALAIQERWGYPVMLAVSLLLRLAALALTFTLPENAARPRLRASGRPRLSLWSIVERRSLLPAGVGMLFSTLNSAISAFLVVHAEAYQIPGAGMFFTVSTLTMFLARSLCSRLTDRRSLASTALFSGCLCIATMLLLGLGRSQTTLLLAGAVFGVGYGTLLPVTQARSVQLAPPERRSLGSSTYYIGIDIGFSLSNLVCGRLVDCVGSGPMYLLLILPALGAMSLALWKGRGAPPQSQE
jgi:MFS family permease